MPYIWKNEDEGELALSRSTRTALAVAGDLVSDGLREDANDLERGHAFEDLFTAQEMLPACFAQAYTPEFLLRVAAAVTVVAGKLAAPDCYLAATVEELAAHAILTEARDVADEPERADVHVVADPAAAIEDVEVLREFAFEDHDVLMLFEARLDGIEDSHIGRSLGVANLGVADWFRPFHNSPDDHSELHTQAAPALT